MNQDWEEKRLLFGRESNSEMTKLHAPDTCLFFVSDKKKVFCFPPTRFNFPGKKSIGLFFSVQCVPLLDDAV